MAKRKATTSRAYDASVAKATTAASVRKATDRSHFAIMDSLNQAITALRGTVQALYHVDTHIADCEDNEAVRTVLSRLLMANMAAVEAAERKAWAEIITRKGGAL
jgi:hypothetical protein